MPDDFDGFLKLSGITSESKDPDHKHWIDVESFGFGAAITDYTIGKGGKLKAVDPTVDEFTFTQGIHKGSVSMFVYCVTGKEIPTAIFHARKAGGEKGLVYFEAHFQDCLIHSIKTDTSGGPLPVETVTLAFRAVDLIYHE